MPHKAAKGLLKKGTSCSNLKNNRFASAHALMLQLCCMSINANLSLHCLDRHHLTHSERHRISTQLLG